MASEKGQKTSCEQIFKFRGNRESDKRKLVISRWQRYRYLVN